LSSGVASALWISSFVPVSVAMPDIASLASWGWLVNSSAKVSTSDSDVLSLSDIDTFRL